LMATGTRSPSSPSSVPRRTWRCPPWRVGGTGCARTHGRCQPLPYRHAGPACDRTPCDGCTNSRRAGGRGACIPRRRTHGRSARPAPPAPPGHRPRAHSRAFMFAEARWSGRIQWPAPDRDVPEAGRHRLPLPHRQRALRCPVAPAGLELVDGLPQRNVGDLPGSSGGGGLLWSLRSHGGLAPAEKEHH
jgi:hypothetical protein